MENNRHRGRTDSFLKEHTSIMTDAGELTLSGQSYYEEAIGETAYNSYTDILYVLPDSICEKLLPVIKNRYITTEENISYENARELEKLLQRNTQSKQKTVLCMEYGSAHYRGIVQ